jgi:hypothetical protein
MRSAALAEGRYSADLPSCRNGRISKISDGGNYPTPAMNFTSLSIVRRMRLCIGRTRMSKNIDFPRPVPVVDAMSFPSRTFRVRLICQS